MCTILKVERYNTGHTVCTFYLSIDTSIIHSASIMTDRKETCHIIKKLHLDNLLRDNLLRDNLLQVSHV